jgi:hypothetical protein
MANNYQAVAIENFGGLDLRSDPQDGNPVHAINMNDVELDRVGRARMRAGTSKLTSVSGSQWDGLLTFRQAAAGAVSHVITVNVNTGQLSAFNSFTGAAITTFTPTGPSLPSTLFGGAMIGVPTAAQVMYLTTDGADFLTKYDGTTFTNTAIGGGAHHVAVQYPDNRLVLANSGLTTTNSRVVFSAANNPESFDLANDYIDLMPGDGEQIVGMANYRNDLFVFKQSAFWRFFGNSTDSVGGTVFNNQMTRHNLNTPGRYQGRVVASGEEGVYFLGADGVYLTTGGNPQKISEALDPIFSLSGTPEYFTSFTASSSATPEIYYAGGRLYLNWWLPIPGSNGTGQLFVYDPETRVWTYNRMWNLRGTEIRGMSSVVRTNTLKDTPYFMATTGSGGTVRSVIGYQDSTSIFDVDHAVSVNLQPVYRTNFLDLGEPASMKRAREWMLEGSLTSGTISAAVNNQLTAASLDTAVTTAPYGTWSTPTWPDVAIGETRVRKAVRGQNFSIQITGSNAGWALNRIVAHVDAPRPAGVRLLT